jgi:hypothetical protein
VVFAISLNLSRFTRRIFTFVADVFADVGMLALACGFLVFFAHEMASYPDLELIYGFFIGISLHSLFLIYISTIDFGLLITKERARNDLHSYRVCGGYLLNTQPRWKNF